MCGIAGIARYKGNIPTEEEIKSMTSAVAHRGPDGEGVYVKNNIALGHRRLAIIDLEAGKQPMSNEDDSLWITYNGELYNYKELRKELVRKGHVFRTSSDTEVIIHSFEEWGKECVKKFRGMFAFCLANYKTGELFLARDQFGIKPLYYRLGENYFAFASEINALRKVNDKTPSGDLQSVDYYLRFQYIPTPHTIFKKIFKLPPASYLIVDKSGKIEGPEIYWNIKFDPRNDLSEKEWIEKTESAIEDSVKAHLVSDVPFGVFLSGGVDSTLVALKMKKILNRPIKAFSIGFKEKEYSELEYAKQAAEKIGLEFNHEIVEPISPEILTELIYQHGEPFGDSSMIPTWNVSKLARSQVPMVLSGDGGDEGFGGYDSYRGWMASSRTALLKKGFAGLNLGKSLESFKSFIGYDKLNAWQEFILYIKNKERGQLWRSEYRNLSSKNCNLFSMSAKEAKNLDKLAFAQYLDLKTYLPCCILTKVDIASMSHGLEVRPPLLDVKVAEVFSQLPLEMRFKNSGSGKPIRKYILKKILGQYFPDDFVYREKQGFAIPRHKWFLKGNVWREELERVILDEESIMLKWFHKDFIKHSLEIHSESYDNSSPLWLLFVLGIWLKQNPEVNFS